MAEFDELDGVLRDALQRAAQPGDSTGVADAIRSRVAAGDPGTSVAGGTAPGWGGGGVFGWLPWLGLVVATGVLGAAVGISGVLGVPAAAIVEVPLAVEVTTPSFACPDGPVVGAVAADQRALAVARSEDSAWLRVRDPRDLGHLVWVPSRVVVVDADQPATADLPVGPGCVVPLVEVVTPTPTPEPEPEPEPIRDTVPPTVQAAANPGVVYVANQSTTIISAIASDNVGIQSVNLSWTGVAAGSAPMQLSGSQWTYTYKAPPGTPAGTIEFTATAVDTSGNSATSAVKVQAVP